MSIPRMRLEVHHGAGELEELLEQETGPATDSRKTRLGRPFSFRQVEGPPVAERMQVEAF